jgi:hypothetical protein
VTGFCGDFLYEANTVDMQSSNNYLRKDVGCLLEISSKGHMKSWEQGVVRSTSFCDAFPLSVLHLCSCGAYATTLGGGGEAVRSCSLEVFLPWICCMDSSVK